MVSQKQNDRDLQLAKLTLDFISEMVFWVTKDARFFMVNESACKSLDYSRDELLKMKIPDIDRKYPMENWEKDWNDMTGGNELDFESQLTGKSGHTLSGNSLCV